MNMNNYVVEQRKRSQTLLIVEGQHEGDILFRLILDCFSEIKSEGDSLLIYGTNIYMLYDDIVREYGPDWTEDDIDLPFVISKKNQWDAVKRKRDFTNIIIVFDYERHDPRFSEQKIIEMQTVFSDAANMGKLYINYPMWESYLHLRSIPDHNYLNRKIPVTEVSGGKYKSLVRDETVFSELAFNYTRIVDSL